MEREPQIEQNLNEEEEFLKLRDGKSLDLEQIYWLRDQVNKFDEGSMKEGEISDLQSWIKDNYQKIPHSVILGDILDAKDKQNENLLREKDLRNKIKERIEELAPQNIPPPRWKINKMLK